MTGLDDLAGANGGGGGEEFVEEGDEGVESV